MFMASASDCGAALGCPMPNFGAGLTCADSCSRVPGPLICWVTKPGAWNDCACVAAGAIAPACTGSAGAALGARGLRVLGASGARVSAT